MIFFLQFNIAQTVSAAQEAKKIKIENEETATATTSWVNVDSGPGSPHSDNSPDDGIEGNYLDVEGESSITSSWLTKIKKNLDLMPCYVLEYTVYNIYGTTVKPRLPGRGAAKRGRPRGSRRISTVGRFSSTNSASSGLYFCYTPMFF